MATINNDQQNVEESFGNLESVNLLLDNVIKLEAKDFDSQVTGAVASFLVTKYGDNLVSECQGRWSVCCDESDLCNLLSSSSASSSPHNPLVVIVDLNKNLRESSRRWVLLAIVQNVRVNVNVDSLTDFIFYVDPFGQPLPKIIQQLIVDSLNIKWPKTLKVNHCKINNDSVFLKNNGDDSEFTCGNFKIVVEQISELLVAGNTCDLGYWFDSQGFCTPEFWEGVKGEVVQNWYHQIKQQTFNSWETIDQDEVRFSRFKTALATFFDDLRRAKVQEAASKAKNYVDLLSAEIIRSDMDPAYKINGSVLSASLNEMRECELARQLVAKNQDFHSRPSCNNDDNDEDFEFEIEKEFPGEMAVFKTTMNVLTRARGPKRDALIAQVSRKFGLDQDQVESFIMLESQMQAEAQGLTDEEEPRATDNDLDLDLDRDLDFDPEVDDKIPGELPSEEGTERKETGKLNTTLTLGVVGLFFALFFDFSWVHKLAALLFFALLVFLVNFCTRDEDDPSDTKRSSPGQAEVSREPRIKTFEEVLDEFIRDTFQTSFSDRGQISGQLKAQLKLDHDRVKRSYEESQTLTKDEILAWASNERSKVIEGQGQYFLDIPHALGIFDRLNELCTRDQQRLRDPQVLALLYFSKGDNARLIQVQTGEGKTTIVAMLAALKILSGVKWVDVITSNPILAQDAIRDKQEFFKCLGITCSTNNMEEEEEVDSCQVNPRSKFKVTNKQSSPRPCYLANVVYGTIGNFQFDYLRDQTDNLEIRGSRGFDLLILDEVDSMLIDNGANLAKLSVPLPGMESLRYVYISIWSALCKAERELANELAVSLMNDCAKSFHAPFFGKDEKTRIVYDMLKTRVKSTDHLAIPFVPKHLRDFAERSLDRWIDNAVLAKFAWHENHHYYIKVKGQRSETGSRSTIPGLEEREVIPIDFANTGVTLKDTIWSHGLHQFIQLKHNLRLTPESLTSSCISNYGYIRLYRSNIFGLSGTLGSTQEQNLMSILYNVDVAKVPTFKHKQFHESPAIIAKDIDWALIVATIAEAKILNEKRAVLIICKTISDCLLVQESFDLLNKYPEKSTKVFFEIEKYFDESHSKVTRKTVKPGSLILATNIAGRGADFKTSAQLEKNGGIHVLTCFLPCNERVKMQAFFRTARQGNRGSAQLVLKESEVLELFDEENEEDEEEVEQGQEVTENIKISRQSSLSKMDPADLEKLQEIIDSREMTRIFNLKEKRAPELQFQDEMFMRFARLCRSLKRQKLDIFVLQDLKELWAFWIDQHDFVHQQGQDVLVLVDVEFQNFLSAAQDILDSKLIMRNPYYAIQQAERFIRTGKSDTALASLSRALSLSDHQTDILYSAHMRFFQISMNSAKVILNRFKDAVGKILPFSETLVKKNVEYKKAARNSLKKAKDALTIEINFIKDKILSNPDLSGILIADVSKDDAEFLDSNLFLAHLQSRLASLEVYRQNVQNLVEDLGADEDETDLAINSQVPNYLAQLDPRSTDDPNEQRLSEMIAPSTLKELAALGQTTVYGLREVQDVPEAVARAAQGQISGGLAINAAGILVPPLMPVTSVIGGAMIGEGIQDIALELLGNLKGTSDFDLTEYVKSKVISYSISLLTAGVGALLSSTKIIEEAIKTVQNLAKLLRESKKMVVLCEFIASLLDNLAVILTKAVCWATAQAVKWDRLTAPFTKQDFSGYLLKSGTIGGKYTGENLMRNAAAVILEKSGPIVYQKAMEHVRPKIEKYVRQQLLKKLDAQKLKRARHLKQLEDGARRVLKRLLDCQTTQVLGQFQTLLTKLGRDDTWTKMANLGVELGKRSFKTVQIYQLVDQFVKAVYVEIGNLAQVDAGNEGHSDDEVCKTRDCLVQLVTDKLYGMVGKLPSLQPEAGILVIGLLIHQLFSDDQIVNDGLDGLNSSDGLEPSQTTGSDNENFDNQLLDFDLRDARRVARIRQENSNT